VRAECPPHPLGMHRYLSLKRNINNLRRLLSLSGSDCAPSCAHSLRLLVLTSHHTISRGRSALSFRYAVRTKRQLHFVEHQTQYLRKPENRRPKPTTSSDGREHNRALALTTTYVAFSIRPHQKGLNAAESPRLKLGLCGGPVGHQNTTWIIRMMSSSGDQIVKRRGRNGAAVTAARREMSSSVNGRKRMSRTSA